MGVKGVSFFILVLDQFVGKKRHLFERTTLYHRSSWEQQLLDKRHFLIACNDANITKYGFCVSTGFVFKEYLCTTALPRPEYIEMLVSIE